MRGKKGTWSMRGVGVYVAYEGMRVTKGRRGMKV